MATAWDVPTVGWTVIVMGWLLSPIFTLLAPKILSYLCFDAEQKLQDLEFTIIPELQLRLREVDQERMMERGKKPNTDVATLDKMAACLRHARYEVEDIFDDAQEKIVVGDILYSAAQICIARCMLIARIFWSGSARPLQWAWKILLRWSEHVLQVTPGAVDTCFARFNVSCMWVAHILQSGSARLVQWARKILVLGRQKNELPVVGPAVSDGSGPVATNPTGSNQTAPSDPLCSSQDYSNSGASHESVPAASAEPAVLVTAPSDSLGWRLSCWCSSFDFFKNCCRSIFHWLVHAIEVARSCRDRSYKGIGITDYQENASVLDLLPTAISRRNLKKRIEKVESTINEVKGSPLLSIATKSKPIDIANKNRIQVRADSNRKVFGREKLRDDIMAELRKTPHGDAPSSSTSPCYSVIGIYGVAGSGKTTFAGYIRDYIKEKYKEKLFDTIMCIHVSETFTVEVIFQEMLTDITGDGHSNISDHGVLNKKLKEALHGKRFFLILDDLWVKNKNDQQLEELISPLNVGLKGSKILVTARTKEAAGALCGDELIEMPDLAEDQYMKMFMHYALSGKSIAAKEFEQVGRVIAKKLHRSPIAAVTVAGRLGANPNISFWKNVAKLDMLNDTMDALWWSYQQLNPDIRRCFEFCNIFPRRFQMEKDQLVRLWIAQGFVKTSCAIEEMEDVAEVYIQELVSCSFLQPKGTGSSADHFTIHDLLHDLLDKVAGNYDGELIPNKILGFENLRTLIINGVAWDTPVEAKVVQSICMRLPKLRVLAISFGQYSQITNPNDGFLVPESIIQLKHLRYLAFRTSHNCKFILPSALAKLLHIQLLDFGFGQILEFNFADLINLRNIFYSGVRFPHIGRLSSLQTVRSFSVKNEEGYEIKQLRDLNKLRGNLKIYGLENVKSKEEALEANLAAKERLTELSLAFSDNNKLRSAEVAAEVLEGLCPPVGLEALHILCYNGSRYPDWMVGRLNGGPKDLQTLYFRLCGQLGPGPELEAFPHLRMLRLVDCSWDALPGNMEHLTSLETLEIEGCKNIRSLPTLPQSLKKFFLYFCDVELMKGCQTEGDPNWLKIKHIPEKYFNPEIPDLTSEEGSFHDSEEGSCDDSEEVTLK